MKLSVLFVAVVAVALSACSDSDKSVEKYPNGNVKFEVPLVDGKKHGTAKGYFEDGTLKMELNYVNDVREGICYEYYKSGKIETKSMYHNDVLVDTSDFFLETGELIQRSIANRHGIPVDIQRFKKDGTREPHMHPLLSITTDTLRTSLLKAGAPTSMYIRIGNVDTTLYKDGTLIISSNIKNHVPADTLFRLDGRSHQGFEYPFTPTGKGSKLINGLLVLHPEEAGQSPKMFSLECKYEVVE